MSTLYSLSYLLPIIGSSVTLLIYNQCFAGSKLFGEFYCDAGYVEKMAVINIKIKSTNMSKRIAMTILMTMTMKEVAE